MSKDNSNDKNTVWPCSWDEHENEQIASIAKNTTPLQRLQWLEEMLKLLRPVILENRKK